MPFKAQQNKDFIIIDNRIKSNDDYFEKNKLKFKKITGSRFASVLNQNKYNSPAKIWAIMTNLYYEEMDETLSKVGNIIEPKIKKYVEDKTSIKYKQYNPFEIKWDLFQTDKIFGGIPDGEPLDENCNVSYSNDLPMLEIKTTSIDSFVYKTVNGTLRMQKDSNDIPLVKQKNQKKESWYINNEIVIPDEYKLQLSLYLYLRNITKGLFAIAFLEKEDYAFPEKFDVSKRTIELVKLDLDKDNFKQIIDYGINWYNNHIKEGLSPELSQQDILWLKENNINI